MRDLYLYMILSQKRATLCRSPSTLAPLRMKTTIAGASILRFPSYVPIEVGQGQYNLFTFLNY